MKTEKNNRKHWEKWSKTSGTFPISEEPRSIGKHVGASPLCVWGARLLDTLRPMRGVGSTQGGRSDPCFLAIKWSFILQCVPVQWRHLKVVPTKLYDHMKGKATLNKVASIGIRRMAFKHKNNILELLPYFFYLFDYWVLNIQASCVDALGHNLNVTCDVEFLQLKVFYDLRGPSASQHASVCNVDGSIMLSWTSTDAPPPGRAL